MSPYETIIRHVLEARVCLEATASEADEAFRLLAIDLEHAMKCGKCGHRVDDHEGWAHEYSPRP